MSLKITFSAGKRSVDLYVERWAACKSRTLPAGIYEGWDAVKKPGIELADDLGLGFLKPSVRHSLRPPD